MSSSGTGHMARNLSSTPYRPSIMFSINTNLEAPAQRPPPETEERLRKKTSIALEEVEPSFDPDRLSHVREADIESSPFGDSQCIDSQDSENEHTSGGEGESDHSTYTWRNGQAQDHGSHDDIRARGHIGSWERFDRHTADKEMNQPIEVVNPSNMDKEELVNLVNNLYKQIHDQQLEIGQSKKTQHYELTSQAHRKTPAELVNDTRTLRERVATWADRYFRHEGSILPTDTGKRVEALKVIVSEPEIYIKDGFLRTWLIQARLWDLLQHHIFDDDKDGGRKYYGHIWIGGRAKRTWLKDAVTKENERVDRDMRPLDDVLRPKGELPRFLASDFILKRAQLIS